MAEPLGLEWLGMPPDYFEIALLNALVELGFIAVHLVVIALVLLGRRRDPTATLAWILFIALAPVVGAVAYLAFGRTRMRRNVRRIRRAEARLHQILAKHDVFSHRLANGCGALEPRTESQVLLGNALASTPASEGNSVQVLIDGAATYRAFLEAIEQGQHHVHLEFYIIQPDEVGTALRDVLTRKAAAGIQVRVLYDAIGSMALPNDFWAPLIAAGGRAKAFSPLSKLLAKLRRRDRVDFRNHRKNVVIDGCVGFTGGINVGREYLGLDPRIGTWRDTHVRIEGPAVLSLQHAFAQDWLLAAGEALDDESYYRDAPRAGECLVQVIDSGPDRVWSSMELYHAHAIAMARQRIYITNPYFIPSQTIESALIMAALRGVDVRLLLPKKSDAKLVTLASRSYYPTLLKAGVRIYEYDRGFVHAKTMVIDDWVATVGSANMDLRSFRLNFELNAFLFETRVCQDIAQQFERDLEAATESTRGVLQRYGLSRRLVCGVARLLSPLL